MRRFALAARRATLGLGFLVSASAPAAEWSLTPTFNWMVDTDSNRYLAPGSPSSQSTAVQTTLEFERATETTEFSLTPILRWQIFNPRPTYGDIFERDITAAWNWTAERGKLAVTADDGDHSTVSTEATQTGILRNNLHQRSDQETVNGTYDETERYSLILQLGYTDVSYYGTPEGQLLELLSGYRYPTATLGEQVQLSESSFLTASAYRSTLLSRLPGNDTDQTGGQVEYRHTFSERIVLDGSIGAARVQTEASAQTSKTGALNLSRTYPSGSVTAGYSRSLVPYGTGTLVQRQQYSLTASHDLTEKLGLSAAVYRVQNGQVVTLPQLGILSPEVQTYLNVQLGLNWNLAETWRLNAEVDATRTRPLGFANELVNEWRASVSVTWTPYARTTSF